MPILLSIKGYNIGVSYTLKDVTTIGRAEDNTIWIPQPNVSRYHCIIEKRAHGYYIRDNNSKNGVLVNGKQITEQLLQPQDKVQIGDTVFIFEPGFDLKNLIFENKTICLTPPSAETIRVVPDKITPPDAELQPSPALELFEELAGLFTPENVALPDTLRNIARQVMRLFNADGCLLFIYDEAFGELQPMVGYGKIENIPLNKNAIQKAFTEKKSVYISESHSSESIILPGSDFESLYTIASAPIILTLQKKTQLPEERCIGVICITKTTTNAFSINDIMSLQAVGRIIALPIELARRYDLLERASTSSEPSPWREIPITPETNALKLIFVHHSMEKVLQNVEQVAEHSTNVLIEGETGTGKELIARLIHTRSPRRNAPFVAVNCAAIPDTLFESELFGHERGAFTGAERLKRGKAELAHGGTLFLDEVSELSPSAQPKLLRFIEEKIFYRVGGTRPIQVDVRIIAATNKKLEELVEKNMFRQDLYYRLSVMKIYIPPLRERPADIKPLVEYFIRYYSQESNKEILGISDEALIILEKYPWKGNVRELKNCIERAVMVCEGSIIEPRHIFLSPLDITEEEVSSPLPGKRTFAFADNKQVFRPLQEVEKEHIRQVLEFCKWNQVKAASMLGIHRNTLRKKIREYQIRPNE
ncbi:sigma 54-interacting transcriptional regulator [Candidatus Sumerlaeota bacterium]|nr:sigma 54-interacting transcriptional regulator [Candidatus Sumerlaeota bacterium]